MCRLGHQLKCDVISARLSTLLIRIDSPSLGLARSSLMSFRPPEHLVQNQMLVQTKTLAFPSQWPARSRLL